MTLTRDTLEKLVTPKVKRMKTGQEILREHRRVKVNAALIAVKIKNKGIRI